MTDNEILAELKKGIDLFVGGTYEVTELYSHLLSIINTERDEIKSKALIVKKQLERLLHLIEELRKVHYEIKDGNKKLIPRRSWLGKEIDQAIVKLHNAGYNTDRFKEQLKTEQSMLFYGKAK